MKEAFSNKLRLNNANKERLFVVNEIIEEYAEQGYKLTLRQLYYQLVSRGIVLNEKKEYGKLSSLLVKGRMAGVVDWDAIEDRLRIPYLPYWVHNIEDALNDTIESYRLNRQEGQGVHVELWVEKDALSGVLRRITSYYHINLMVNRGYSSCTAMHDAYIRFTDVETEGKEIVVLYLGDHDPSGLDMIRDITNRLEEFGLDYFTVKHIGLTREQINKYDPPPNPARFKDPRAEWYMQEYGNVSWEVDALNPEVLHALVKENVESLIDMELFEEQIRKEGEDKKKLKKYMKMLGE